MLPHAHAIGRKKSWYLVPRRSVFNISAGLTTLHIRDGCGYEKFPRRKIETTASENAANQQRDAVPLKCVQGEASDFGEVFYCSPFPFRVAMRRNSIQAEVQ